MEFWNALRNDQDQDQEHVMVTGGVVGQRKVVEYDIDFGLFDKAVNSGVVPPFSISGNDSEMCLPARQNGWERLRRKFAAGVMKDLVASSKEAESPGSCSSSDDDECMSPDSFSSFLVDDPRKFDNTSPSISPTTSDHSNSFSFSPTSSNWSDLSVLEASDPNPNLGKITPSSGGADETPKKLVRTWSFSMDDQSMQYVSDDGQDSMFEAENEVQINDQNEPDFVLYQWPTMEKVEKGSMGIPESRGAYVTYVMDVLYIWVGHDFSGIEGHDDIDWQMVGQDFLVKEGLETSSTIQIVKEGEEPEQLWKHLHCFSFQNAAEKDQNG
ncbi:hypothetical protein L1987_77138 [Smallanthus sonchifolius]|uniref:Uncharacterized protein n=1 Tax=Smallanthus sonchifolius TaxID=185202 RepID=A0ACB8Z851_9ASTR|nr:hypothetical protein L1987_77138 [Smallanthus sonchifolius]